ncbi:uncharacterized protein LOC135207701 [Macrobrachium nipponense]|uniref:uncharacterized protein LOC135207701 n=1 Tax=Macrobrachium nipponense TaxID=159736 RepID=UPI0030C89441
MGPFVLFMLCVGIVHSQTTTTTTEKSNFDGEYTEWEIVGDLIGEPLNDTDIEDDQGLLDAADPPVLSDDMCFEILRTLDQTDKIQSDQKDKPKLPSSLQGETQDQPGFFGPGSGYRPTAYSRCYRTRHYGGYPGSLCYGRRRVVYGYYSYCCRNYYFRPFVFRRGRYIRCRCY